MEETCFALCMWVITLSFCLHVQWRALCCLFTTFFLYLLRPIRQVLACRGSLLLSLDHNPVRASYSDRITWSLQPCWWAVWHSEKYDGKIVWYPSWLFSSSKYEDDEKRGMLESMFWLYWLTHCLLWLSHSRSISLWISQWEKRSGVFQLKGIYSPHIGALDHCLA